MLDFLKDLGGRAAKKIIGTIVGVAICLGFWTFFGSGADNSVQLSKIPTTVFEGGGGTVTLELVTNHPARLYSSFSRWDEAAENDETVHAEQKVDAGTHTFNVNMPNGVSGYFELQIDEPQVGAEMGWNVKLDGRTIWRAHDRLDEPLKPGYAFFLQAEFNDLVELASYSE